MAVNSCDLEMIKKSVKSGDLSVNSIFSWGQYNKVTLLQFAIFNSDDELIDLLLENHVDLNISTLFLGTALHVAINQKKLDVVKKLVSSGADINIMPSCDVILPPLHESIRNNTNDIAEFLVKSGADVNLVPYKCKIQVGFCSWSPLNLAIILMNIPMIELLLKHHAIIDEGSNQLRSSLQLAVLDISDIKILRILEKFGAKIEIIKDGEYTLEFNEVVKQDEVEIFKLFVKKYPNFLDISNLHGVTIAYQVVVLGGKNILRYLLDCGISVNVVDKNNSSLLDVAMEINILQTLNHERANQSLEIIKIIEGHIIKLSAAGLYVNKRNSKAVNSEHFKSSREKCEEEINELKTRKISDTNFNYFDLVVKNVHRLAVGLRYSDFCFIEDVILTEFEVYGSIIIETMKRAVQRKELLKNAAEFIQ
ncbi:hypothetical protein KQX54_006197 [Cotesia glomerata]|uniref:Uncharacterized protein n=1 Tax=Cotesia glomerata TaxID=32391 RepID=A0AAV7IJD0_COTGL|nr:hypothetical protein KQX54_006197 [Cotesia glomerata]